MSTHDDHIRQYSGARAYLDQLVAFAEAAQNELAPDSPLGINTAGWLAEIQSYQQFACQRCGTFVSSDPFGAGAYSVEDDARVCAVCYEALTRTRTGIQHRCARLAVYAQDHPELCAGLIVAFQRRHNLDDWQLDQTLGLDELTISRLALCPRPRPDTTDLADLARVLGCVKIQLQPLFSDER